LSKLSPVVDVLQIHGNEFPLVDWWWVLEAASGRNDAIRYV
jgi:hypothetical protein